MKLEKGAVESSKGPAEKKSINTGPNFDSKILDPETSSPPENCPNLPGEVWKEVFEYLPVGSRLEAEAVCPVWSSLMPYHISSHVDVVQVLYPDEAQRNRMDTLPANQLLYKLLERCGDKIRSISFGRCGLLITPTAISWVVAECPKVESVDLSYCKVTENIIPSLMGLKHRIKSLNLSNTVFTIRDWSLHVTLMQELFSQLECLEEINMQNSNRNNFTAISYLPETVKRINLNECAPITYDVMLTFLRSHPDLEELHLSTYVTLDRIIFDAIINMHNLKVLDISHVTFASLISFQQLASIDFSQLSRLRQLTRLNARHNHCINDAVINAIADNCTQLENVDVSYCLGIRDLSALSRMVNLKSVTVGATDKFDDVLLTSLAEHGKLTEFRATSCVCVSAAGIMKLVSSACGPNLTVLEVGGQWESDTFGDAHLLQLLSCCKKLQKLLLHGCSYLTDGCLTALAVNPSTLPVTLNVLDLSYARQISDVGIEAIAQANGQRHWSANGTRLKLFVHQTKVTKHTAQTVSQRLTVII